MTNYFNKLINTLSNKSFFSNIFGYILTYGLIIMMGFILYSSSLNVNFISSNFNIIIFLSILFASIFIVYALTSNILKQLNSTTNQIIAGSLAAVWGVLLIQSYFNISYSTARLIRYAYILLIILIVLVGLAILSSIFGNYMRSLDGIMGFVAYFIFYIPCMISDFIKTILEELKITNKEVYILYIIEAVLVFLLFLFPPMMKKIVSTGGLEVLYDPVFLDKEMSLTSYEEIKSIDKEPQSYSISLWTYMNTGSNSNNVYKNGGHVLSYGDLVIKYKNNNDEILDMKAVVSEYDKSGTSDNLDPTYGIHKENIKDLYDNKKRITDIFEIQLAGQTKEFKLPLQRWSNIVINRTYNDVDIFINGKLTTSFVPSNFELTSTDRIKTGQNGLSGAICNVMYYNNPQTKSQVAYNYNLYQPLNPPIL